ncbi:hypothetical protein RUND412_007270 [Rhizina undulata]
MDTGDSATDGHIAEIEGQVVGAGGTMENMNYCLRKNLTLDYSYDPSYVQPQVPQPTASSSRECLPPPRTVMQTPSGRKYYHDDTACLVPFEPGQPMYHKFLPWLCRRDAGESSEVKPDVDVSEKDEEEEKIEELYEREVGNRDVKGKGKEKDSEFHHRLFLTRKPESYHEMTNLFVFFVEREDQNPMN